MGAYVSNENAFLDSAIVRISSTRGEIVGAGFLIEARVILTCAHIVAGALGLRDDIREPSTVPLALDFPLLAPGRRLTAAVFHRDPATDIAVLRLEGDPPPRARAVPLKEAADLWEHRFRAFGFPQGQPDGVWASGVIRGPNARGWLHIEDVKETGYRIQPGFSGSPVWDEQLGGVVGMVSAAERDPTVRAGFIIPTAALRAAWPTIQPSTPASSAANPFTDMLAVKDPARFVGRERALEQALRELGFGSLLVLGERKIGKSSLLWQLKRRLEADRVVVFWDFFEPLPADRLLREAIARLGGEGKDWEDFRRAVSGRQVVLLLDELDLAPNRGFDLDMLRGCRALGQKEAGFRVVAASCLLPKAIFPPPPKGSTPWDFLIGPVVLDLFTEEEALRLLAHPWAPDAHYFDTATCRDLIARTGRHPFRLQRAAHHRYEALADPAYDWLAAYKDEMAALE